MLSEPLLILLILLILISLHAGFGKCCPKNLWHVNDCHAANLIWDQSTNAGGGQLINSRVHSCVPMSELQSPTDGAVRSVTDPPAPRPPPQRRCVLTKSPGGWRHVNTCCDLGLNELHRMYDKLTVKQNPGLKHVLRLMDSFWLIIHWNHFSRFIYSYILDWRYLNRHLGLWKLSVMFDI